MSLVSDLSIINIGREFIIIFNCYFGSLMAFHSLLQKIYFVLNLSSASIY